MIESIRLRNFQRHKDLLVELSPHLTVLIGESDVGKSSVIRALRFVCFNRPSGSFFIKHGTKNVRVDLRVDGHVITRQKGEKGNVCVLDKKEFAALRRDVPEEVANLLNVSEVNVSQQHEATFWLSKTAGEVSKELNAVINLDLIDKTLSILNSRARKSRDIVEMTEDRLRKATFERDRLSWVKKADLALEYIEKQQEELSKISTKKEKLAKLLDQGKKYLSLSSRDLPTAQIEQIEAKRSALRELQKRLERFRKLIREAKTAEERLCRVNLAEEAAKKELLRMTDGKCPLCQRPSDIR